MLCIYCQGGTKVTNSRQQKRNNQVWRRRRCRACGAIFTSHEAIDLSSALIVDYGGSQRPFIIDMLFTEVLLALQDRKDCYIAAREVTNTTIRELLKSPERAQVKTRQISRATARVLKRLDRRSFLRYAAEHPSLQKKNQIL